MLTCDWPRWLKRQQLIAQLLQSTSVRTAELIRALFNYRLAYVIGASANSLCNDSNLIQIFTKKCPQVFLVYSSLIAWIKSQIGTRVLKRYAFLSTQEFLSLHDSKRERFFPLRGTKRRVFLLKAIKAMIAFHASIPTWDSFGGPSKECFNCNP